MTYQPKPGAKCSCKPGVQRDNCPVCEGTGWIIDFAAIRNKPLLPVCPNCGQWQRPENGGDCLNECRRRGFAS